MTSLHRLAEAVGVLVDWEDAAGTPQRVSDEAVRRVLGAIGYPAEDERQIAASMARWRAEQAECSFLSADVGGDLALPDPLRRAGGGCAELELEDGQMLPLSLPSGTGRIALPADVPPGYHRLHIDGRTLTVAVAPPRCFTPQDAAPGRKLWGGAVQVPSLRGAAECAFGDFGALATAARAFAAAGADALAISPTHALFPADASRYSPYAPSSRSFLNILFGDPGLVGHPAPENACGELIDWHHAVPERLVALRSAFTHQSDGVRAAVAAFRAEGGVSLERHARFDALHAHFFPQGARGWQDWPDACHDPAGAEVAAFADAHAEEVDFYLFGQWLARNSLHVAQTTARDAGMAIGLIADLAVGMDGGGSHAWSHRDELLTGLSIGAPPDLLGPEGQSWGITSLSPFALQRTGFAGFIATLRASLGQAGGIRIDHALGLRRLWLVPNGASSAEGAYLTMPLDDMLRIIAIESQRARAIVIGEDLGTVPEGLRPKLEERALLGMRVLWFERDEEGAFAPPSDWDDQAVAMTGTHDLPTVAGWWRGRDIAWNRDLDRGVPADEAEAERTGDRHLLWLALEKSGATTIAEPPIETPSPVVDAALVHVASSACPLAILPVEDLIGAVEQPNLPGTIDEHPNWRRRLPAATDALLTQADVAARTKAINEARRS